MKNPLFNSELKDELLLFVGQFKHCVSESTFSYRCYQLQTFDKYLTEINLSDGIITAKIIDGWLSSLTSIQSTTIISYQKTVFSFLRFRMALGKKSFIPVLRKNTDSYIPYYFTDQEMDKIYQLVDNYPYRSYEPLPFIHVEFPMIIRILDGCGTRLGETLTIQMKDVDLDNGIITLRHTKKNKERFVPVSSDLKEILKDYCEYLGIVNNPEAFIFPKNDMCAPVDDFSIYNRFHKVLLRTGIIKGDTPKHSRGPCLHCLRHRFAVRSSRLLEEQGIHVDDAIPYLSIYLGHNDLRESEKYLKNSIIEFSEQIDQFGDTVTSLLPDDAKWDIF